MNLLSDYGWLERWSLIWLVLVVLIAVLYMKKGGTTSRQKGSFVSSLVLIYAAVGSPFQAFAAHGLFSAYMLQQSVLYLVVPPLMISGIPNTWLRPFLWRHSVKNTLRVLTYPWLTAVLFNVGFSVYLLPGVFNEVHGHPFYTGLVHLFLFAAALLMWWSILSPLRELNPLSELQQIFYIFITAIMLTPIAMLLLFADEVLYPAFAGISNGFSWMNPIYDQQIGAGILKGFQLTVYGVQLGVIVYQWVKKGKESDSPGNRKKTRMKQAD